VGGAVVAAAEELGVGEAGGSAVGPVLDVVSVAPGRRDAASRVRAPTFAGVEGSTQGSGDGAGGPADIEWLPGWVGDEAGDSGVAGESAGGLWGHHPGWLDFADAPGPAFQALDVERDGDVGTLTPNDGSA